MTNNLECTVLILAGGSLNNKTLGPGPALSDHPADLPNGSGLARQYIVNHYRQSNNSIAIKIKES